MLRNGYSAGSTGNCAVLVISSYENYYNFQGTIIINGVSYDNVFLEVYGR